MGMATISTMAHMDIIKIHQMLNIEVVGELEEPLRLLLFSAASVDALSGAQLLAGAKMWMMDHQKKLKLLKR